MLTYSSPFRSMATSADKFNVGGGFLARAYGKHVVGGTLIESRVETDISTGEKTVYLHTLLGINEWDGLELLTYDGVTIDLAHYTFHPGIVNPPQDVRFPNSLRHGRIARYTAKLPKGIADEADPSKMKAVCRCQKITVYNSNGSVNTPSVYSTNPADHFVDLIAENCERLGLPLFAFVDWQAYADARLYYGAGLSQADYNKAPRNFRAARTSGGALAIGDWLISVQATGANPAVDYSLRAGEILVSTTSGNQAINAACDAVPGASGYRWWLKQPSGIYIFFDTALPTTLFTSGGSVGTPPTGAGGAFSTVQPRFESHVFFNSPTSLESALNAVLWQCASDYQRVGKKYRILTPESRTTVYSLSPANTMPNSFRFWRVARDKRPNRITAAEFRNITDPFLRPVESAMIVNREESQAKVDIINEDVPFFSMTPNQAYRLINWRIRTQHDLSERAEVTEDGTGVHALPGDIVEFTDETANWINKKFLIVDREIGDSDGAGNVTLGLQEHDPNAYSDNDSAPLQSTQPVSIPSRFLAPSAITNLALTQTAEVRPDNTLILRIEGDITFTGYTGEGRQKGLVYQKKPGAVDYTYLVSVDPDPTTGQAGFRVDNPEPGLHHFKVLVVSGVGIAQSTSPTEYNISVDYSQIIPPAIVDLDLFQTSELKEDGTVVLGVRGDITFGAFTGVGRHQGLVYHKKPAGTYEYLVSVDPDPATNHAGFQVSNLNVGIHWFKIKTITGTNTEQSTPVAEFNIVVEVYDVLPPSPNPGDTIVRNNDSIVWSWTAPTSAPQITAYEITDVDNNLIARVDSDIWHEPAPNTSTVVRRVYSIDAMGNRSATFLPVTYNADYEDNRVVYNTPIGSANYVRAGDASITFTEDPKFLKTQNGDFDDETRIYKKTSEDGWDGSLIFSRSPAFGDCTFEYTIPYSLGSQDITNFGFSRKGSDFPALSDYEWSIEPRSFFHSGTGNPVFVIHEKGQSDVGISVTWVQGDKVTIEVLAGTVRYYKNATLLYTSPTTAKYPLYSACQVWNQNQTVAESSFKLSGRLQNTETSKLHWQKQENVLFDANDDLIVLPSLPLGFEAGAYSVEHFRDALFVEFNHCGGGANKKFRVGIENSYISSLGNYNYEIEVGTSDGGLGTTNQYFVIRENGSQRFIQDSAGFSTSDKLRIAMQNGVVKYYLNGGVVYTSLVTPDPTVDRWHVQVGSFGQKVSPILGVRAGSIGAKGAGWRIKPDGVAELAKGVKIGNSELDEVRVRTINAIRPDNRYRGNDFGSPLESRLNVSMFRLGNIRTLEDDIYNELFIDIPDSVLEDPYSNFDSVKLARVKVLDIFGNTITEVEQAFTGRGKLIVGIHSRHHCDPVDMGVYSIQFRNVYGWSKPIYWTQGYITQFQGWGTVGSPPSWNGTTTPPTWKSVLTCPTNVRAVAVSPTSIQMTWTPPVSISGNQDMYYRIHEKGKTRANFLLAASIGNTINNYTFTGLNPNTEYEVMSHGDNSNEWGNLAYVETMPPFPSASRPAPTGLSVVAISTSQVQLNWTRNATDNNFVLIHVNGVHTYTEFPAVVTKNITGLTAGATYQFKVVNNWTSGTALSDFSNEVQITMPNNPPPTNNDPTNLTAVLIGDGNQVQLNWNRNSGSNGQVQVSSDGVNFSNLVSGLGTTTTHTHTAGFNRHRWYRVFNDTGGVNFSNTVDIWTSSPPTGGGGGQCVTPNTMILVIEADGRFAWKRADEIRIGEWLVNKFGQESIVTAIMPGFTTRLYVITTDNGKQVWCSPSHPILQSVEDNTGKSAAFYKLGDSILTYDEGEIIQSCVAAIETIETPQKASVLIFQLEGEHSFVSGGLLSHNLKPLGL